MTRSKVPPFFHRIWSVWFRHFKVYSKNLISNGFPPFLEPLIFLAGIGMGLGMFVPKMEGVPYIQFLASGLLISTAMMTSAFECSYGTFIRLEFEKSYDGMIAAPITATNLLVGEILWAGSKGFFFSFAVLVIVTVLGIFRDPGVFLVPLIGFLAGAMFASASLVVTSFVKVIDHFSFYFTGFLSPMMFLSGVVFPVSSLPAPVQWIAEALPLTHPVRLARALCFQRWDPRMIWDAVYIVLFIVLCAAVGIRRLRRRLVD